MTAAPNLETARKSLGEHAAEKGAEILAKYGPKIGWSQLLRILEDRACVRYPCRLAFEETELQPGEFAYPKPNGARPEDGFTIFVHPLFMTQLDQVPMLVLYHLVLVNYGAFASSEDAEQFGAAALGLTVEDYYRLLCESADQLAGEETASGGC